jgi:hypothetical protein
VWLDLNGKLRELLAEAFLDQQDDFGWCRLRDFHDVEATSPASHFCFAIKAFRTTRIILLEEGPALLDISCVENLQPPFRLVTGGCIGQL